mmetsp:Transcript_26695/g.41082  ORF Transcript_26695/g.41082 Transcript_26695/m.41082 type:complete len:286 (+) Transcript_26695:1117-1974(+)
MCLSSGLDRAKTCSLGRTASNSAGVIFRNCSPVIHRPSSVRIPACFAMAFAVSRLSPVTMRTKIPAFWQVATAPTTSSRRGSAMPTRASKHISFSSLVSQSARVAVAGFLTIVSILSRWARATQRSASLANSLIVSMKKERFSAVRAFFVPSVSMYDVQFSRINSAAPLWYIVHFALSFFTSTVMRFLALENGKRRLPPSFPNRAASRLLSVSSRFPHADFASRSIAASVLLPMSWGRVSWQPSSPSSDSFGAAGGKTRAVEQQETPSRIVSSADFEIVAGSGPF